MKSILHLKEFWTLVDQTKSCWVWKGATNNSGYGYFRRKESHRLSYELFEGPIPEGLQIDHLCRNRLCVNPAHLQAVTRRENVIRGIGIFGINARKTHCKLGHPLEYRKETGRPNPRRFCRTCHNTAQSIRKSQNKTIDIIS